MANAYSGIKKLPEDLQIPDLKERSRQGHVHLIRFVRSNRVISVFGEKFTVPEEAVYQYVKATIDVKEQKLSFLLDNKLIPKYALIKPQRTFTLLDGKHLTGQEDYSMR